MKRNILFGLVLFMGALAPALSAGVGQVELRVEGMT